MTRKRLRAGELGVDDRFKRRLVTLRECGLCRACCTTQRVEEMVVPYGVPPDSGLASYTTDEGKVVFRKPADVPCPHLNPDTNLKGCTIYSLRPQACRDWMCVWRSGSPVVEGAERPDRVGVVLDTVVRDDLPFSFLVAVATEPADADACFERASAMIARLVSRGHLVVSERPGGHQTIEGPKDKVAAYAEVARVVAEREE